MARSLVQWRNRLPNEFNAEIDGLLHTFFGPEAGAGSYTPHANYSETEAGYEISLDLPGIEPDAVSIELLEGKLVISGERAQEAEQEGRTWHRVERRWGHFERSVTLPKAVDPERIDASFKNGVLLVTLPKREAVKPKKIEIRSE
ncbi:Hsp20/alpha crystallin family protein [Lignipirellula cremea]|uniref:Spore protein SP21 n=1 Tax=Lignipirellula cremea TaxID=2528010 RepID=A0A518DVK4_9BACT|nr:Hsp20/alpha crystallin family protein [Lignipirellula cremea]QDU95866.1 Spore protein SP21 [Lignipirellula cremea]